MPKTTHAGHVHCPACRATLWRADVMRCPCGHKFRADGAPVDPAATATTPKSQKRKRKPRKK